MTWLDAKRMRVNSKFCLGGRGISARVVVDEDEAACLVADGEMKDFAGMDEDLREGPHGNYLGVDHHSFHISEDHE